MDEGTSVLPVLPALSHRRTTPDHIADALREAILSGAFKDGEELNQVSLAEHFGVSRVPVREALRQLQAEGLISAKPHRRAIVTALTLEHVVEIFEIRALLESYLLEKSLDQMGADDLLVLEKMCREMQTVEDHKSWLLRNRELHRRMYEPAGRAITLALVDQLTARIERYMNWWSAGQGVRRVSEANGEHRAILAAARDGDVQRARGELELHIARTRQEVERLFPVHGVQA